MGLKNQSCIYNKIFFADMKNQDACIVSETDNVVSVKSEVNEAWEFSELDFGNGEAKSLTVCYKVKENALTNRNDFPFLQFWLDEPFNGEPVFSMSCRSEPGFPKMESSVDIPVIVGKHRLYISVLKGNAFFEWFSFSKNIADKYRYVKTDDNTLVDIQSDTWVAEDDLGRALPTADIVGLPRKRYVGVFYFLWHQKINGKLFDHDKTYREKGIDGVWQEMTEGEIGYAHYWSRPYFGYYRSDDEWIIRKHAKQLVNAGVDFIFFDTSNNYTYPATVRHILKIYKKMREEGNKTPQFVFFFGRRPDFNERQIENVYYDLYESGEFEELYFKWDGKPLILADRNATDDPKIRDFFTFRLSWAFNKFTGDGLGKWPWMAEYPQSPGRNDEGTVEQISVSCGFHPVMSKGRSYYNGMQPTDGKNALEFELESTPDGIAFDEQWKTVEEYDPPIVMITGWNEWWAGRWQTVIDDKVCNTYYSKVGEAPQGEVWFNNIYVDCFNPEFSRDIEPMKDGFKDNYYYQMVSKIRQFKGVRPIPKAYGGKEIIMNGDFRQMDSVGPEYRDNINDTVHRNEPANAGDEVYINNSGRNDIVSAKVSRVDRYVYFYVKTSNDITEPCDESWMNLFINSDCNYKNGWYGYNYILNRKRDGETVSVERFKNGEWNVEEVARAQYMIYKNELLIKVSEKDISLSGRTAFDFKWADNSVTDGDIMKFIDMGDAAPADRFNFRYIEGR